MKSYNRNKKLILVLSVLLIVIVGILGISFAVRHFFGAKQVIATAPDNWIGNSASTETENPTQSKTDGAIENSEADNNSSIVSGEVDVNENAGYANEPLSIEFSKNHANKNLPFHCDNWLPGDSETQRDRIKIYFHDSIAVHFKVTLHNESDALADVLKIRVVSSESGNVLYDGFMRDVKDVYCENFSGAGKTTVETEYEVTAYLENSVGNAYMNKHISADFSWWITQSENLDIPATGDTLKKFFFIIIVVAVLLFTVTIIARKRRRI